MSIIHPEIQESLKDRLNGKVINSSNKKKRLTQTQSYHNAEFQRHFTEEENKQVNLDAP